MGTRVVRKEDPRFMTRGGVYTSDLRDVEILAGDARVVFVRSTVAHGVLDAAGYDELRAAQRRRRDAGDPCCSASA
jgi:carbon-monoxide dehydrogenase large subunit